MSDKDISELIDELHSNIQSIFDTDGWYVDEDGEDSSTPCVALQSALAAVEEFEQAYNEKEQALLSQCRQETAQKCAGKARRELGFLDDEICESSSRLVIEAILSVADHPTEERKDD